MLDDCKKLNGFFKIFQEIILSFQLFEFEVSCAEMVLKEKKSRSKQKLRG